MVLTERSLHTGEPTIDELRVALVAVYGSDFGLADVHWMSRFTDATFQAATYRDRRVLLAGDAAHIHPPHGGQGLNVGLQDAVNLGWKLAGVVHGRSPDALLDTYHAERHPVAARVLHNTLAQVALTSGGDRHQALRDIMTDLLGVDEGRRQIASMLCGLDIAYDLDIPTVDPGDDAHPLVGRRMPDLDLDTADGPTRVSALLHDARPVLLNFAESSSIEPSPAANQVVRLVHATPVGPWTLPILGDVDPTPAVLIRPDGHVAWTGHPDDPTLAPIVSRWFGDGSIPQHHNA